nr:hypothetical protein [Tanacetum cinerariifolium]
MVNLDFYDYHNMVAILEKTEHNTDFHQIVDFLEASHIRRHLKLNDEEGISSLPDADLFGNLSLMGDNILPSQRRLTKRAIQIAQSKVLSPAADEPASLSRDDRHGKAFPTISSLDAGQDRENIAKTSAMSHESSPMVLSLNTDEGSMQQRLHELIKLCTSLQRQQSQMVDKIKDQDVEISGLNARVKSREDKKRIRKEPIQEDAPITGGIIDIREEFGEDKSTKKGSSDTKEMVNVLSSMESVNILSNGGTTFSTASVSPAGVPTVIGSFPTVSAIFITANVATPYTKRSREKVTKTEVPKKKKLQEQIDAQVAREMEEEFARENQRLSEQAARDSEIAKIHAKEELKLMIEGLDRSNEVIAKHLSEYEQAEADLSVGEKIELISELVKYQDHLAEILKYQAQQSKPSLKKEQRRFYMSVLKSHAGWKNEHFRRMTLKQIKEKFIPVWKHMQDFVPMSSKEESEKVKRPRIKLDHESSKRILVKKTFSIKQCIRGKEKELWVELKRLFEPDSEDQLWTYDQAFMHNPLDWKLYDTCVVHHVSTKKNQEIFMLVEKDYPLRKGLTTVMISNKLQVRFRITFGVTVWNKMLKSFPLPVKKMPLLEYFSTASEEVFPLLSQRDAPVEEVCTAEKLRINHGSRSVSWEQQVVSEPAPQEHPGTGSASESFDKKNGRTVAVTTKDMQKRRNDVKARTTLLLALPDEHQLRFSKYKTAQELWAAILKIFGRNEATKKTKKNQLKQQYGNFKAEEWLMYTIVWRNRGDLDRMSLDHLYNHLKVYEPEVQKKSKSNSHNMAFISSAKNSSGKGEVNTASILTTSTYVSPTRKKITIQGTDVVGFDKSKVECFNSHKMGHVARECRAPRIQDMGRREIYKQNSKEEERAPKALMTIDEVGWDCSYMANEEENHALVADEEAPTEFALMTKSSSSSENEVFDYSLYSKSYLIRTRRDSDIVLFPPPAQVYSPSKKDMSWTGLPEFADDTITNYSRPSHSVESNSSDLQNSHSSVSEHGESSESIMSKPTIKFVKAADSPTGNSQNIIDDKGYWDSGCSRHMTGNISYLSNYEPYDGGYVSFGQGGGKITGKGITKTDKLKFENVYFMKDIKYNLFSVSQICDIKNSVIFTDFECIVLGRDFKLKDDTNVLLRTPRQHNMYSIDLNNIVPLKDLTCLVTKASADESMLWHRRLGHLKFKTMNKLVRHNLVKGLPSKCFENDHTYVACLKGKQHKASYKTKLVNSVSKPLHTLHMDQFGPTSVRSLNHKWYCLVVTDDFSRCDNGVEFRNKEMNNFCSRKWIKREFSNVRTPQQNRVAERRNKTLIEAARTMLADAKLPTTFWAEAVNTTYYVQNKVLVNKSQNKTPYELFNGRTHAIGFLKPFGCHVMILNTLDHLGKFDAKEDEGTKDAASQDVKKDMSSLRYIAFPNWFHEAHLESSTSNAQDSCNVDASESSGNFNPTATSTNLPADQRETLTVEFAIPTVSSPVPTACLETSPETTSGSRLISKRVTSQDETSSLGNISTFSNRKNLKRSLMLLKTQVGLKLCRKNFFNSRFRMFGFWLTDLKGIYSLSDGCKKCLFYGTIDEEVYVMQPSGFQDPEFPDKVYKVEKAMYGLHQAPRAWYGTLSKYLLTNGFQRGTIDQTLFIRRHRGDFILVQVYVDDIIFGSSNLQLCREFEALMHDKFQISAMGELNFFLGLQVLQKKDGIFLSQDKYIGDILKKFRYSDVRSPNTPMDKENPWGKDGPGKDVELHLYRSMIRSLMYLTASRPDIMFAVCTCAKHQVTPKEYHVHVVKRIFKYLKGHTKLGLWYPKESPFDLVAYSDSDYGGATQDRKSTTGGCQFLGRRLILWQCKKQTIVATFTTEAEYVAAASGCGQVLWIQNQLLNYGIKTTNEGTKILATADGKPMTISESSIRRNLNLNDGEGIKAFLTVSGLEAGQDRENIIKTSALPHDSTPRVTSLAADEGNMQHKLQELTDLCTHLQRQQTEMASKIAAQDLEISSLKVRIKLLEDKDKRTAELSGDDASIKERSLETGEEASVERSTKRGSNDTEELINVLTSLDAANILTSRVQAVSVPHAAEVSNVGVPTGSGLVPTVSLIFTTASVVTPYSRRKGKEKMVESDTPNKKKLQEQINIQMAREIEEQIAREDQRMDEQIERDAEIARIHAEEELPMLIDGLDRNNEVIAKHLHEYEQSAADLTIGEKIELINEMQQREFYTSVLRSHSRWKTKHFRGMTLEEIREKFIPVWKQIEDFVPMALKKEGEKVKRKGLRLEQGSAKKLKTSEEVSEEDLKEMMQLVPVEEVYVEALQVKHPIIDWEINTEGKRVYWKIIRLGGHTTVYQFFVDMLKQFDREDLNQLWVSGRIVENKMLKSFPLPVMKIPLPEYFPTASEEVFPLLS